MTSVLHSWSYYIKIHLNGLDRQLHMGTIYFTLAKIFHVQIKVLYAGKN